MIKDTKIGVKGMEVWKKSPLFHGMTEQKIEEILMQEQCRSCLLYTSDAADEL